MSQETVRGSYHVSFDYEVNYEDEQVLDYDRAREQVLEPALEQVLEHFTTPLLYQNLRPQYEKTNEEMANHP